MRGAELFLKALQKIGSSVNRMLSRGDSRYFKGDYESIEIEALFPNKKPLSLYETPIGKYVIPSDIRTDVIAAAMKSGKIFDENIIHAASKYIEEGSCVLDVGANFGQMSIEFSKLVGGGASGKVYSFEADPYIFEILKLNLNLNAARCVTPVFGAVWNKLGQSVFYPEPDFKRFKSYGSYGIDPRAKAGRELKTITIDSLDLKERVSFLKVDIQGSDLFALQGAKQTILKNQMPIIFEYEEQFQSEFKTSFSDYERFINEIGYKIVETVDSINYLLLPKKLSSENSSRS